MSNLSMQRLTLRELEVLVLVASGASAKEIARTLDITARTVEAYINRLRLKTQSRNRAHLVAMALEQGLIENPCHIFPDAGDEDSVIEQFERRSGSASSVNGNADYQGDMFRQG
jgi:DNA-binding CsgD family transcriptional regulator